MRRYVPAVLLGIAPFSIGAAAVGFVFWIAAGGGTEGLGIIGGLGLLLFLLGLLLNAITPVTTPLGVYALKENLALANYELDGWKNYAALGIFFGPLVGTYMYFKRQSLRRKIREHGSSNE